MREPIQHPRKTSNSAKTPWTEDELRRSVEVYVVLLRMQINGFDAKSEPVAQALLSGPLALRNDTAIRYRMRNISAVVNELGGPILSDFSPAESVGRNMRPRIRAILLTNPDFSRLIRPASAALDQDRADALSALTLLRERVEALGKDLAWLGHNNPPGEPGFDDLERGEIDEALSSIDTIRTELEQSEPDVAIISRSKSQLIQWGTRLAKWIGERTTKFADAALLAAAPVAVAKISGLLPALVDALEAVTRAAGH